MESELGDSAQYCACTAQQSLGLPCLCVCPTVPSHPAPPPAVSFMQMGTTATSFLEVYHASAIFLGLRVSFCVEAGGHCGKLSLVPGRLSHLKDAKRLLRKKE